MDCLTFSSSSSWNWNAFWNEAFGGGYHSPHRTTISDEYLLKVDKIIAKWILKIVVIGKPGVSFDGFSNIKSRPVFHLLAGSPIPFHFSCFRLSCQRESSHNVDKFVFQKFYKCFGSNFMGYGYVSDLPNVMIKARRLAVGDENGWSTLAVIAYRCACHTFSLIIKNMIKIPRFGLLSKCPQI